MKEPIKYLFQKYGADKLPDVIASYMKFTVDYTGAREGKQKKNSVKAQYQPQGEHERKFLSTLTAKSIEL